MSIEVSVQRAPIRQMAVCFKTYEKF